MPLNDFERYPLLFGPSPVHPLAGLIELIKSGDIPRDSNVLYAHLGGQPALNAYSGVFR